MKNAGHREGCPATFLYVILTYTLETLSVALRPLMSHSWV